MLSDPPTGRTWARAEIKCSLQLPSGARSADTTPRCWYFEIPRAHDTVAHWKELLPRIMFDINTTLRNRQPGDMAWIDLESARVYPLQPRQILVMDENLQRSVAWVNFDRARSWEPAVCYYVDDAGRYDMMSAHDFSELLLYRLIGRGEIMVEQFKSFLNRYFSETESSAGERIYADGEARLKNLTTVREDLNAFKKTPNQEPFSSCPDVHTGWGGTLASTGIPEEVTVAGYSESDVADGEASEEGTASVYLEEVGESLIRIMMTVRDFNGLSVGAATRLTKSVPAIVMSDAPRSEATRFVRELQRMGAKASLR